MKLISTTLLLACIASPLVSARAAEEKVTAEKVTEEKATVTARPVAERAENVWPLPVGTMVPNATLQTSEGKAFNLTAAIKAKPTVLIFYRGGWCPFCNAQLSQLQGINGDLGRLGYQILAISPDKPTELEKMMAKDAISYMLLSDSGAKLIQQMGLAFRVDDATMKKYQDNGIDLEESSGEKHHILPVPGVFVLDQSGTIQFSYVNPNFKVRLNAELLLTAARLALLDNAPTVPASAMVKK